MEQIFIYMDDSGKLTNDPFVLYGGVAFLSKKNNDDFIRKYRTIINRFKCNDDYCEQKRKSCDKECPELKSYNLQGAHRRQLMNLIKKQLTYYSITETSELKRIDLKNKYDVGRFQEYAQKLAIRNLLEFLVFAKRFEHDKNYTITIFIDQDTHVSNGRYDFTTSLNKELFHGFNKGGYIIPPVFTTNKDKITIIVKQNQESHYVDGIQASDIFVGTTRRNKLYDEAKYKATANTSIVKRLPK